MTDPLRLPLLFALLLSFTMPGLGESLLGDAQERVIQYEATDGLKDPVALLQQQLAAGKATLPFEPERGYLPALLKAFRIPASSQMTVFSKTSSQRDHINPQNPRAIYFGDEVSLGWVPGGEVLDIAAVDPQRGPIFYSLEQKPAVSPRFVRGNDCMQCHLTSKTLGVPGLVARSVYTASNGVALADVSGFLNGHSAPISRRWGGWYVTGSLSRPAGAAGLTESPGAAHLGNIFAADSEHPELTEASASGQGALADLGTRLDISRYLSPYSDIVALLVLEHQVRMQNLITRANYETRCALAEQAESGARTGALSVAAQERVHLAGEMLLEYMLFRNEAPLPGPVRGSSGFAEEFQRGGAVASGGRSLRQLDLRDRLFRYPCSFLIYSSAFDALPIEMKNNLWSRLAQILTGQDHSATYAKMPACDRRNLIEILRETKPEFRIFLGK